MSTPRTTHVFGPAYLDRVLRVDRPLIAPTLGGQVDRSVSGRVEPGPAGRLLVVADPDHPLSIELPDDWPGPFGTIVGDAPPRSTPRAVRGLCWAEDLGGMGAGYAKALGGTLARLAGAVDDPTERVVGGLLRSNAIADRPIRVPGRVGEWTLLITSGEHGDKLAVGFRSPSGPVDPFAGIGDDPCDLLVVASMTNAPAFSALRSGPARVTLFAPSLRNIRDESPAVVDLADRIGVLSCNRGEWESLADRDEVARRVAILVVTDGPRGAEVRYTRSTGEPGRLVVPAFPRRRPPVDTNRAGEAFASNFVATLLDADWTPGPTPDDLARLAATRASAASAVVLDRADFGFPTRGEVDRAVAEGVV